MVTQQQRDEAFKKAVTQVKQQKQERELKKKSNYNSGDFEKYEQCGLVSNEEVVFRIVGLPVDSRLFPTDPKHLFWSKVLSDTGKSSIFINWKQITNAQGEDTGKLDEDWLLMRLY